MHTIQKILFVVNSGAGVKQEKDWEEEIKSVLKDSPVEAVFHLLKEGDNRQTICRCIDETRPQKVVAVGGDGTVKMVAEAVKESTLVMGIIPAGSANGLAKELTIPAGLTEALEIVINGKESKLDAIRINEEDLCFHLGDAGLNALLVKYFERYEGRGMWGYTRSLAKMLWYKRRMRVRIETDNETVKRKAFMVALANAEKYGTGAIINPNGNVADGEFEVVVVRNINILEVFKSVMAHRNFNPKHIEVFRTKTAKLVFQQAAPFQVDGEYRGKLATVEARILPGIVKIMLPDPLYS